jgi:hypothetical protein
MMSATASNYQPGNDAHQDLTNAARHANHDGTG